MDAEVVEGNLSSTILLVCVSVPAEGAGAHDADPRRRGAGLQHRGRAGLAALPRRQRRRLHLAHLAARRRRQGRQDARRGQGHLGK